MQDPTLELCYQYLARLSHVRDTEIGIINVLFRNKLGETYLSIVSNVEFGYGNGQVFVIPVDHDSFFNLARLSHVSDTEIEGTDLVFRSQPR